MSEKDKLQKYSINVYVYVFLSIYTSSPLTHTHTFRLKDSKRSG